MSVNGQPCGLEKVCVKHNKIRSGSGQSKSTESTFVLSRVFFLSDLRNTICVTQQ